MTVGTQTLSINPGLGDGVGGLLLSEAEHLGDNGGGSDLDQDDVVEADLVVGVLEGQNTLDLVGLDHGLEDIADLEDLAIAQVTTGTVGAGDPVGDGEDTTQVVGGVTPLSGEPAVVVVQPTDHGTDVEGAIDGVQLVGGTGDAGSVGDDGALNNGAEELGALLEFESLETTAQGVQEDETSGVKLVVVSISNFRGSGGVELDPVGLITYSQVGIHFVLVNVAGHILDLRVISPVGRGSRGTRLTGRHGGKLRGSEETRGSELGGGRWRGEGGKSGDGEAGPSAGR